MRRATPAVMFSRDLFSLATLGLLLLLGSGCASTPPGENNQHVNVLGLVEVTEGSYAVPDDTTFHLSEGEVASNDERTGREVKLLWGLITYTDY